MSKIPVFLSFSGDRSRAVARLLRTWLPDVLQAVDPWTSTVDIETGERWGVKIGNKLQDTNIGILCLTPDNVQPPAPWIMFEAGALSKQMDSSRVTSLCCFGVSFAHLQAPLNDFQNTQAAEIGSMIKLVSSINTQLGVLGVATADGIRKQVERCWPEWEAGLAEAEKSGPAVTLKKPEPAEQTAEILARMRDLERLVRGLAERNSDATRLVASLGALVERDSVSDGDSFASIAKRARALTEEFARREEFSRRDAPPNKQETRRAIIEREREYDRLLGIVEKEPKT